VTKLTRAFVVFTIGAAILAAGSAVAVRASVNFVQGFSAGSDESGWTCSATVPATAPALNAADRWNGEWHPATADFSQFAWAGCTNGWAYGYVTGPRAEGIDLSTLPIMR
jgi:hypothetical protein